MRIENRGLKIEDRKKARREIPTLCALRSALCRLPSLGAKNFVEGVLLNILSVRIQPGVSLGIQDIGQGYSEPGALSRLALDLNGAVHESQVFLDDGEPKADTLAARCGVNLMKPFEDLRDVLRGDPQSSVFHYELYDFGRRVILDPNLDLSRRGVLEGVYNQVLENLFQLRGIRREGREIRIDIPANL